MKYIKFTDPRPSYKFAYACGNRNFGWLFEKYPQDAAQAVSLALCAEPEIGKRLASRVVGELRLLAQEMGFYRPKATGRWAVPGQVPEGYDHDGKRTVFVGAPACGTQYSYKCGCRCEMCRAANTYRLRKYSTKGGGQVKLSA